MNSHFLQFLATGVLGGNLRPGAPVSAVEKLLGTAFARYTDTGSAVEIWRYGPLQITISPHTVMRYKIGITERDSLPRPLAAIALPSPELTPYELFEALNGAAIAWEVYPKLSFDRQLCILVESRVQVHFDLDRRELQSFYVG